MLCQKYVMTFLMNLTWGKPSYTLVPNIICIVLYRNMCMVSIKEYIIQNPPYQSSGPMLVILSISKNMEFGVTREVLSIGPQRICPDNRYKWVMTKEMNVYLQQKLIFSDNINEYFLTIEIINHWRIMNRQLENHE